MESKSITAANIKIYIFLQWKHKHLEMPSLSRNAEKYEKHARHLKTQTVNQIYSVRSTIFTQQSYPDKRAPIAEMLLQNTWRLRHQETALQV